MLEKLRLYSTFNEVERETLRQKEQDVLLCELYLIVENAILEGYSQGYKDASKKAIETLNLNDK